MIINLLEETVNILKKNNLQLSDIEYILTYENDKYLNWAIEQFIKEANEINYDNGYGLHNISLNLKIVGKDWWLERSEYDGSEWWTFKTFPNKPIENGTGNIPLFATY